MAVLADGLTREGVAATRIISEQIDVKSVRVQLGFTQEQFAMRYGLELDAMQLGARPDEAR